MTKPVVYIVLYSLYHHIYKLALSIQEGLESKGVQVELYQVEETLPDEVLVKMKAPPKPDIPIITADKLSEPDGILFGLPTRFGTFPAQIKTLLDASGSLWAKGALVGKFTGTFFSTASQHGGQETTALAAITYFSHQGMLYVPFGYADAVFSNNEQVIGGSPYGAGTVTNGDGSRLPSELELQLAKHQGENFGVILSTFIAGNVASIPSVTTTTQLDTAEETTTIDPPVNQTNATTPQINEKAAAVSAGTLAAGTTAGTAAVLDAKDKTTQDAADTPTTNGVTKTSTTVTEKVAEKSTTAAKDKASSNDITNTAKTIGKKAGKTAAGATTTIPKPKKKSKWFCCIF